METKERGFYWVVRIKDIKQNYVCSRIEVHNKYYLDEKIQNGEYLPYYEVDPLVRNKHSSLLMETFYLRDEKGIYHTRWKPKGRQVKKYVNDIEKQVIDKLFSTIQKNKLSQQP